MTADSLVRASEVLANLQTDDPEVQRAIQILGDAIAVGSISGTGIAVGRNARAIVQHFNLPADQVAALLEMRGALLGLDPNRYRLQTLLADKTRDFVGREYVFEHIRTFLKDHPQGYLLIEAEPGLGKSAILAEFVRQTGCIAHFNVRSQGIVNAAQFLESVCTQLIVDYGLPYAALPQDATRDSAVLEKLLLEATSGLEPGERVVIAVDALDEVDLATQGSCGNILCLPATLPDGVYFVMTMRPVTIPFVTQSDLDELDLMQFPADNRRDVERYLERSIARPGVRAWIESQDQLTVAEFVNELAGLSENNFMYLRYVLPEIEAGQYRELKIAHLPRGLEGYYEDHWIRMGMTARPLPALKITIVYIMCEVRQPVSLVMIAEILNHSQFKTDPLSVQEVLTEWDQFLHEEQALEGKRYSVYHASFRDFLFRKDIVQAAGVTMKGINALIADYLWAGLFGEDDG